MRYCLHALGAGLLCLLFSGCVFTPLTFLGRETPDLSKAVMTEDDFFGPMPEEMRAQYVKPVTFTPYLSTVVDPFPSAVGVNLAATFYDAVRVGAGFGAAKFAAMGAIGFTLMSWGGSVRVNWPGWVVTPTLGMSWAGLKTRGSPFRKFGDWDRDSAFWHPSVGMEWRFNKGSNLSFGAAYPLRRHEGRTSKVVTGFPYILPFMQMGIVF